MFTDAQRAYLGGQARADAIKPGMGRGVEVRGWIEILEVEVPPVAPNWFSHDVMRLHPVRILSWHIDPEHPDGESRTVAP